MKRIILVAETGSDISPELAERYGIRLVPMHVTFGDVTEDDGTFPPERIEAYYRETGNLPKTSGSTPGDFETVFDQIHAEDPEAEILYLAYSAVTTCSYQSAMIAAEGRDYVTALDTRQVSVGQAAVVVEVAEFLEKENTRYYIRGLRNGTDFDYENANFYASRKLDKSIVAVYLPCPQELLHVSSSMVRSSLQFGTPIDEYVTEEVKEYIEKKFTAQGK